MPNTIDEGSAEDPRLAAIRRAMQTSSLAGTTSPDTSGSNQYQQGTGGNTPVGPLSAPGSTPDTTSSLNPTVPGGSDVVPSVPGQNAPPSIQTPDAISRATTGGSLTTAYSGPTAEQQAAIARALADTNAANTRNAQTTTIAPPPPLPPTQQPLQPLLPQPPLKTLATGGTPPPETQTETLPGGTIQSGITDQTGGAGPGGQDGNGRGQGGDLGSITNQLMGQIQNIGSTLANPGTPTDVTGVFLTQAKSILALLDQQEADIRAESEKNGTTIDRSTAFTIDKLRETLTENIKTVREDLNRRGLNDSGIELELENRLQKGNASDEARLLADRLTNIQAQLSQGLSSIRSQKYDTLGKFGLAAANAQTTHDENRYKSADDREQAALQALLGLRGQVNTSEISAADNTSAMRRALLQEQGQNTRNAASLANAASIAQGNNANDISLANLNNDSAMARALATARGSGGSTASTPTQINNPYGGSTKTGNNVDANATNQAISAIGNATSRDQAQADLFKSAQALTNAGVDVNAVQDAINSQFPESADAIRGQRRVGGSI